MRPDEVEEYSRIQLPESPAYETIGGLIMARLGRVAAVGDIVEVDGVRVAVERMEGRRIDRVRIEELPEDER